MRTFAGAVCLSGFLVMLLLLAPPVAAEQLGGPTVPTKGKWALGIGSFYYEDCLETHRPVVFGDTKQVQNRLYTEYIEASYGLGEGWEVYGRAGAADVRVKRAFTFEDFQDTRRPFGTLGFRGLLFKHGPFALGNFVEASKFSSYDSRLSGVGVINGSTATFTTALKYDDPWEATYGLSLQYGEKRFAIYGGPFVYLYRVTLSGSVQSSVFTGDYSVPYQEKTSLGGNLGFRLFLGSGFTAGLEGQYRSRYSFGAFFNKSL